MGCSTLPPQLLLSSHSSSSKESSRRGKAGRLEVTAKVGENGISLLRRISLPKTSGRARRIRHQRNTHASYATNPTESLDALNRVRSLPTRWACLTPKRSFIKGVNARSLPIKVVARGALIQIASEKVRPTLPLLL